MRTKNAKRILAVTIKTHCDNDPDTSHLGEYSSSSKSKFTIDRAHSLDCPINTGKKTWVIVSDNEQDDETGEMLYWSNADGWVDRDSATTFGDAKGTLPITGTWEEVEPECDCGESGDMGRNEYQFFNPSFNYVTKGDKPSEGLTPEDVRKYTLQDYERMERLNRGDWCYLGVSAECDYQLTTDGPVQELTSGGLWGVESDSDKSYIAEVEQEQLSELKTQLVALGFSKRAIATAFKDVERKEA